MLPWSAAHGELSVLFPPWGVPDHTSEMPKELQTLLWLGSLSCSEGHSAPLTPSVLPCVRTFWGQVLVRGRPS